MYLNKIINLQEFKLKNSYQIIEMSVYSAIGFFLPIFLGHPQYLVGSVVNMVLVLSALNLQKHKIWPVIILPCIGALVAGLLFGPFTVFLLYFIPFIWIGNIVLVFGMKWLYLHKKINYAVSLCTSALVKSGFLFLAALVLYNFGLVPVMFLTAMGLLQLETALIGGAGAFVVNRVRKLVTA